MSFDRKKLNIHSATVITASKKVRQNEEAVSRSWLDRLTMVWLCISGWIHIFIEGTWLLDHKNIHLGLSHFWTRSLWDYVPKGVIQQGGWFQGILTIYFNFWRAGWKEYAKGDGRYLTSDFTLLSIESITALFDAPMCFLAVYAIWKRKPYRWIVVVIVSICQIYGDIMYFLTEYLDGLRHIDPSNWTLHFYVYFCGFNTVWMVIPGLLVLQGVRHIIASEKKANLASVH